MKKRVLWVAAIVAAQVVSAGALSAQLRPVSVGIAGGPSFPLGDEFREEAGTGFHVQGSLGFRPPLLPLGFRADLLFQQYPDEHDGNFREIGGLANAIVTLPSGVARPYLIGGIGAIRFSVPDEEHGDHVHEGGSETNFSYAVGAGIEIPFVAVTGLLEARFIGGAGENRGIPVSIGIRF